MLTLRLLRLQARANAHAAGILTKNAAMSLPGRRIFVLFDANGKISPVQIVRQTRFDKGMNSRTLKRMHKKELEHVETSESDRRSYVVDVTPQDRTVIERARPMMRQRQNRFQQAFDREELGTLFRAFKNSDSVLDHMEEQH